jgi:hypothetical protein
MYGNQTAKSAEQHFLGVDVLRLATSSFGTALLVLKKIA